MDLNTQIQTAIRRSPYLAGRNVRFQAFHGRVVLQGQVSSYFQKQMAQEVLRGLDGVVEIVNDVQVVSV